MLTLTKRLMSRVTASAELGWHVTREASVSLIAVELYPLGLLVNSMPVVPSLDKKKQSRPILFLHGVFHNRSAFTWIKQRLRLSGWHRFFEINHLGGLKSIESMAEKLAEKVESIRRQNRFSQVDIIAHSMGGLIARHFVHHFGGDGIVKHLITLGTPHQGTAISKRSLFPTLRELSPMSDLIRGLNSAPTPRMTRGFSIGGSLDILMHPREASEWPGMRHCNVEGLGHTGLLFSSRVAKLIADEINN